MRINLQDPTDFTIENLRKLIASQDDSIHTQFRVTKEGYLFLSLDVGCENISNDILFTMETMIAGNDYVGTEASKDDKWVSDVFKIMKANWPKPVDGALTYVAPEHMEDW